MNSPKFKNPSEVIDNLIKKAIEQRAKSAGQTPESYARAVLYGHLFPQETLVKFYEK
jgi:hypothetical protein